MSYSREDDFRLSAFVELTDPFTCLHRHLSKIILFHSGTLDAKKENKFLKINFFRISFEYTYESRNLTAAIDLHIMCFRLSFQSNMDFCYQR